jgi:hypothetical protein
MVSRRNLLATGTCALLVAACLPEPASASALGEENLTNEEIVRKWYAAWENKDLGTFNALLADNFTFTSAAGDAPWRQLSRREVIWRSSIEGSVNPPTSFSKIFLCHELRHFVSQILSRMASIASTYSQERRCHAVPECLDSTTVAREN